MLKLRSQFLTILQRASAKEILIKVLDEANVAADKKIKSVINY
jgi:hypothetical protein